jgi:hypothetical protein
MEKTFPVQREIITRLQIFTKKPYEKDIPNTVGNYHPAANIYLGIKPD